MSNNLKKLREAKGISQTDLAKMLGISDSHLNKVENESKTKRNLTASIAVRAAKILDVSLDQIFLK